MKEEVIQAALCQYLSLACPDVFYFHIPNGMYLGSGIGRFRYLDKLKRQGLKAGVPDLFLCWLGGSLFIETKTPKGRLSPAQEHCIEEFRKRGLDTFIVHSIDDLKAVIKIRKIPTRADFSPVS